MSFLWQGKAAMRPREAAEYIAERGYIENKKRLPRADFIESIFKHLENQRRIVRTTGKRDKLPFIELSDPPKKGEVVYHVHTIDEHYLAMSRLGAEIDPGQTHRYRKQLEAVREKVRPKETCIIRSLPGKHPSDFTTDELREGIERMLLDREATGELKIERWPGIFYENMSPGPGDVLRLAGSLHLVENMAEWRAMIEAAILELCARQRAPFDVPLRGDQAFLRLGLHNEG